MLKSICSSLVLSLCVSTAAQATSLHPCTPTREMQSTVISCSENGLIYGIKVKTLASRAIPMCQGQHYMEIQSAEISVVDGKGKTFGMIDLYPGSFSYELNGGDASFRSEAFFLDLKNCNTPQFGGLSFGN